MHTEFTRGDDLQLEQLERTFFDQDLLACRTVRGLRDDYFDLRDRGLLNPFRSYPRFLEDLSAIAAYKLEHARGFTKRVKRAPADLSALDSEFAEIIVYREHLRLVEAGHLRELARGCADIEAVRPDGSVAFLEVLTIRRPDQDSDLRIRKIVTHTQDAKGSVRQKLLSKALEQKQFPAGRENWAVIELNDATLAGDFAVLASLSGGYRVEIDAVSGRRLGEGYDTSSTIFDLEEFQALRGIMWFSLGDFARRNTRLNPHWESERDA